MKIILTGFMGSGKSTLAKFIAQKVNGRMSYIDLDTLIQNKTRMKIESFFSFYGEKTFRRIESNLLSILLENSKRNFGDIVISLGGGTIANPYNFRLITKQPDTVVVYLDVSFDTIWERIKNDLNRPLVKRGYNEVKRLYIKRLNYYKLADIIVDANNKSLEDIANEVIINVYKFLKRESVVTSLINITYYLLKQNYNHINLTNYFSEYFNYWKVLMAKNNEIEKNIKEVSRIYTMRNMDFYKKGFADLIRYYYTHLFKKNLFDFLYQTQELSLRNNTLIANEIAEFTLNISPMLRKEIKPSKSCQETRHSEEKEVEVEGYR